MKVSIADETFDFHVFSNNIFQDLAPFSHLHTSVQNNANSTSTSLLHQQCLLFGSFWNTELHPPVQLQLFTEFFGEVPHESGPETCSNMSARQGAVVFCRSSDAHTMDGCIFTTFIRYLVPIYAHLPGKKDTWTNRCKLYVFVSDVLVHPVKVRRTPWSPRCVFSWARCHEINWNPTKDIQRLPLYIVQCSKVVHLLCICGRNAWCLTRTCTYKQLFLPGWHMVVTNWKKKTSTSRFDQELPICAPCTPVLCGTGAKDYFNLFYACEQTGWQNGSPFLSPKINSSIGVFPRRRLVPNCRSSCRFIVTASRSKKRT